MDHRGQHAGRPPAAGAAQLGSVEGKAPCETKRDTGLRELQLILLCIHTRAHVCMHRRCIHCLVVKRPPMESAERRSLTLHRIDNHLSMGRKGQIFTLVLN